MPLDAAGARRFYDRFGRLQDLQRLYEGPAARQLVRLGAFDRSRAVFELGCGTGRLATELLSSVLPPSATYLGVDVSPTMVRLAIERTANWRQRATVRLLEPPALQLPGDDGTFDRFVSTYVFDLLTAHDAHALVGEAARLLAPGGLLALASLTHGTTPASRLLSSTWNAIALRRPSLVGGCRPIELADLVGGREWQLEDRTVAVRFAVPFEVLIARRAT